MPEDQEGPGQPSALQGLLVLELGGGICAAWCARQFADLGAQVIKVEPPGCGDPARRMGPFPQDRPHPEKSGLFLYLNANKLGVTLDVASPTGRRLFLELAERADALVENHSPQETEELGLTYETLRQSNPRLVLTSISPFGQTGPYSHYKGSELVCFQMAGIGYETPWGTVTEPQRQQPLKGGGHQAQLTAGWMAASATMVALFHRRVTGHGQHVDLSEQETLASTVRPNITWYSYEGRIPGRIKDTFARISPCKDGYVSISIMVDSHWPHIVEAMGNPEWAQSEVFDTRPGRVANYDVLEQMMLPWFMDHTRDDLFQIAQRYGFMLFPLNTVKDLYANDHYAARGLFQKREHPLAGAWPYPRTPYLLSATPPRFYGPAPLLGQHNGEVYGGLLGRAEEELAALGQLGVI
ncbi:MAG: CoA transferase [Chloroflexi bacterium]|nr:CoA transferase [Chloroflexota bacterium]